MIKAVVMFVNSNAVYTAFYRSLIVTLDGNRLGLIPSEMMKLQKSVTCGSVISSNPKRKAGNEE